MGSWMGLGPGAGREVLGAERKGLDNCRLCWSKGKGQSPGALWIWADLGWQSHNLESEPEAFVG